MANNRMFLKCVACGESDMLFLGKRMGSGYYMHDSQVKSPNPWFDRHEWCGKTLDHFVLAYEHSPDEEVSEDEHF